MKLKNSTEINLFIDTNIYKKLNYNFNHHLLKQLKDYCIFEKFNIYSSLVVIEEVKSNIKKDSTEAHDKIMNFINKTYLLKSLNDDLINGYLQELKDLNIESILIARFEDFIDKPKTIILDYNGIKIEKIFSDYFQGNPPFSNKTKKKSEFPDSVIIEQIKLLCKELQSPFYIITNDEDFNLAFDQYENVHIFKSIEQFLDSIIKNEIEDIRDYIHKIIKENNDLLIERIEALFNLDDFQIGSNSEYFIIDDTDILNMSIQDITIEDIFLTNITDNHATVQLNVLIFFEFEIYSSGMTLYKEMDEYFNIELEIEFNINDKSVFIINRINIDEPLSFHIELNDDDLEPDYEFL